MTMQNEQVIEGLTHMASEYYGVSAGEVTDDQRSSVLKLWKMVNWGSLMADDNLWKAYVSVWNVLHGSQVVPNRADRRRRNT